LQTPKPFLACRQKQVLALFCWELQIKVRMLCLLQQVSRIEIRHNFNCVWLASNVAPHLSFPHHSLPFGLGRDSASVRPGLN
jgi:hypothetical protein